MQFVQNLIMKYILLFLIIVGLYSGGIGAQTEQGKFLVGLSSTVGLGGDGVDMMRVGKFNWDRKSIAFLNSTYEIWSMNIKSRVGYFVVDNLAVGVEANVLGRSGNQTREYRMVSVVTSRQNWDLSGGVFGRYYIPVWGLLPFVEVGGAYGFARNKERISASRLPSFQNTILDSGSVMSYGGGAGVAVPLGGRVALDVLVGYTSFIHRREYPYDDGNHRSETGVFGLNWGCTILLGEM